MAVTSTSRPRRTILQLGLTRGERLSAVESIHRWSWWGRLNFVLTNRLPRRWATRLIGWFSRIRHPWVCRASIAIWQAFAGDLRLHEARRRRFSSMHECFIRELQPGSRPLDERSDVLVSPCDAILGAAGAIDSTTVLQAKGAPYRLEELLGDEGLAQDLANGTYATLRIKANMYHRFHAPTGCRLTGVRHIHGDTWNVNPPALARVDRLFCRNTRAVLTLTRLTHEGESARPDIVVVAVAAILVASIRIHALDRSLRRGETDGRALSFDHIYARGEEMGYFEQGSTIVMLARAGLELCPENRQGDEIRMGQGLMRPSIAEMPPRGSQSRADESY